MRILENTTVAGISSRRTAMAEHSPHNMTASDEIDQTDLVSIKIRADKLLQLIEQRVLTASDLKCYDYASKSVIRKLCLLACLKQSKLALTVSQAIESVTSLRWRANGQSRLCRSRTRDWFRCPLAGSGSSPSARLTASGRAD